MCIRAYFSGGVTLPFVPATGPEVLPIARELRGPRAEECYAAVKNYDPVLRAHCPAVRVEEE
jgi:hypothetical protein